MFTTLRLLLLLMLGLFGLQPVGYCYDAPVAFVSGAQNIVAASPESQAATAESAASEPLNFNREGTASDRQAETRTFSNFVAAESAPKTVEQLVKEAQEVYPNKANIIEQHHITPQYMGGQKSGPTVPLDAAYHQQITNEFRSLYPYGQGPLSPAEQQVITNQVYTKYPLPPAAP